MNRHKIVIVDDEPIIRMDIKEMLQEAGYDVAAEAKNGEEAIELAHKHRPDLIILDVKMPMMDGIKAAQIIRKFSDASILLLTAYSHTELVEEACRANVAAYLVKPVSEVNLIPAIEVALRQRKLLKEEIGGIKRQFEERKIVERAKGKMMSLHALSEPDAHRWLQKESMNRQMSVYALAVQLLRDDGREGGDTME